MTVALEGNKVWTTLKTFSIGVFYFDDSNYEVCCYFVMAQLAMAVNTSPEVGDKQGDYVNAGIAQNANFTKGWPKKLPIYFIIFHSWLSLNHANLCDDLLL